MAWNYSTQDDNEWNNCILFRLSLINFACFAAYSVLFVLLLFQGERAEREMQSPFGK